jgi:PAS domain S-box-containing protein
MTPVFWKPATLGLTAALAVLLLWSHMPHATLPVILAATIVMLTHAFYVRELQDVLRADRQVRAAEERFRDLFENVTDLIQSTLPDGSFLYVNRAWRETLGYTEEEVGRLSIVDVIHPDSRADCLELFRRVMSGENLDRIEIKFMTRDGTALTVEGCVSCRFAGGKPLATRGIFRDVSARKSAEERLRLSEVRYQSLVESLPQSIFRKDPEGRFTFANRRFCEALGQPLDGVLGKTDGDFFPPDLAAKYRGDDQKVMATGAVLETVEGHQNRNGERFHVQVVKVPLRDEAGRPLGIQGIFWDVTERVRAEEQLRHAKEAAESANRAKNEFLATVSHEIRTPMNGILGMTDLLLAAEGNARQREYLGLVKVSAESLLAIINDLLDFSKIEAGRLELDATPFRLRASLNDVMRALSVRAAEKELHVTWHVEPSVPDDLIGDRGRLAQVLVNLVGNAIKFTERGAVALHVRVDKDARSQGDRETKVELVSLAFDVRDTGIGIPADKLTAIFEPFVQADSSTTRKYGGTGLGLAIVRRLVSLMDGTLSVESELGRGSAFRFTIRFQGADSSGRERAPNVQERPTRVTRVDETPLCLHARAPRRLHVLVAEDNPVNQTLVRRLLEAWGHSVVVVTDGARAADAVENERFDVVLMDLRMPGVDGFAGVARIREAKRKGGGRLPVVAVTAQAMKGDRERCLEAGFDGYVTKPIRPGELKRALDTLAPDIDAASRSAPEPAPPAATDGAGLPALDRHQFLSTCQHDADRQQEIKGLFRAEVPRWSRQLSEALARRDARELEEAGHTIKAATAQFGGNAASAAARRLEEAGRAGDLEAATGAVPVLTRELDRFLDALNPVDGQDGV